MIRLVGQFIASNVWAQITAVVLALGSMSPIVSFFYKAAMAPQVKVQEQTNLRVERLEKRDEQQQKFNESQTDLNKAMIERLTSVESDSLQLLRMSRMIRLTSEVQHSMSDLTVQVAAARAQMSELNAKMNRQGAATEAIRQKVKAGEPVKPLIPGRESR